MSCREGLGEVNQPCMLCAPPGSVNKVLVAHTHKDLRPDLLYLCEKPGVAGCVQQKIKGQVQKQSKTSLKTHTLSGSSQRPPRPGWTDSRESHRVGGGRGNFYGFPASDGRHEECTSNATHTCSGGENSCFISRGWSHEGNSQSQRLLRATVSVFSFLI